MKCARFLVASGEPPEVDLQDSGRFFTSCATHSTFWRWTSAPGIDQQHYRAFDYAGTSTKTPEERCT